MPETILWSAVSGIALWILIYASVLFGFLLYPEPKRRSGGAAGYASVIWLFCVGDFFVGPLLFAVFIAVAIAVVIARSRSHARP